MNFRNRRSLACAVALVAVWVWILAPVVPALSQSAVDPETPGEPMKESMTLQEIIETGGWLMYVLGAMSVLGLALIVYFLVVLRQNQVVPREFVMDLREMLGTNRYDEARLACEKKPSPIAAITSAAIDYSRSVEDPEPSLLKEIIEGEGSRQATLIQNQTQYLLDIAIIAPMVGLLGTVMGMLRAFNSVALDISKAKPMLLAAGVSQALITTAAGLIVGIPAMVAYAYFRGRGATLLAGLETASADLLTLLVRKKKK